MTGRLMPSDPSNIPPGRPSWCICGPAWWSRQLLDPACRHDDITDLLEEHQATMMARLSVLEPEPAARIEAEQ